MQFWHECLVTFPHSHHTHSNKACSILKPSEEEFHKFLAVLSTGNLDGKAVSYFQNYLGENLSVLTEIFSSVKLTMFFIEYHSRFSSADFISYMIKGNLLSLLHRLLKEDDNSSDLHNLFDIITKSSEDTLRFLVAEVTS